MKKRKLLIPLIILVIAIAIAAAVLLRKAAPPEPVRLLPEAQAYLYVNAKPLRRADVQLPPVQFDAEYGSFVAETGIQFERDLDEAAFAVHVPPPGTPNPQSRYSEVFVARFNVEKLRSYLHSLANRVDSYRDVEIFNIPIENRRVRVSLLGPDMVAVSNVDDPLVIRGIIDRYKRVALPFGGPALVRSYYRKLPFGTVAWAIADIARDASRNKPFILPGGLDLFLPPDTVAVASIRYLGSIDFKLQVITPTEEAAQRVTDQLSAFLALFRTLELNASGKDPDLKAFLDSLNLERNGKTLQVSAELPKGFIKKIFSEPPPAPEQAQQPAPEKPQPKKRKQTKP